MHNVVYSSKFLTLKANAQCLLKSSGKKSGLKNHWGQCPKATQTTDARSQNDYIKKLKKFHTNPVFTNLIPWFSKLLSSTIVIRNR